jgi:hypothetical protein
VHGLEIRPAAALVDRSEGVREDFHHFCGASQHGRDLIFPATVTPRTKLKSFSPLGRCCFAMQSAPLCIHDRWYRGIYSSLPSVSRLLWLLVTLLLNSMPYLHYFPHFPLVTARLIFFACKCTTCAVFEYFLFRAVTRERLPIT